MNNDLNKGLIHLYCGDGKGKTTAAFGLVLRALGRGMRVVVAQFLKGRETGEITSLERLADGVVILRYSRDFGFYMAASDADKAEMKRQNNANLNEAARLASEGSCDMLVLDEICAAYNIAAIDTEQVDKLLWNKPAGLELVLTGRAAPQHFYDAADYVTEFVSHKHPYDRGTKARKGIEY